jgi:hypothetical protein
MCQGLQNGRIGSQYINKALPEACEASPKVTSLLGMAHRARRTMRGMSWCGYVFRGFFGYLLRFEAGVGQQTCGGIAGNGDIEYTTTWFVFAPLHTSFILATAVMRTIVQ